MTSLMNIVEFAQNYLPRAYHSLEWHEAGTTETVTADCGKKRILRSIYPKNGYYSHNYGKMDCTETFEEGVQVWTYNKAGNYFGQVLPKSFQVFDHKDNPEKKVLWAGIKFWEIPKKSINEWIPIYSSRDGWGGGDRIRRETRQVAEYMWDGDGDVKIREVIAEPHVEIFGKKSFMGGWVEACS